LTVGPYLVLKNDVNSESTYSRHGGVFSFESRGITRSCNMIFNQYFTKQMNHISDFKNLTFKISEHIAF
jgi:hypothetical protein